MQYRNAPDMDSYEPDDSSEYITSGRKEPYLDLNNLTSGKFTNIDLLNSSPSQQTEVYTAVRYGKRFALKGIKSDYRKDPIMNMALMKEFEIGISLDHPNIRRTIGFEEVEDHGYMIILEYIDGSPLDEYIHSNKITPQVARSIVIQVASALQYIHNKQIYHRDLKLSNILVSHNGAYAKIIDFNLSDSESYIILKNPAGTKKYIAPEIKDASSGASVVADIYSFGIIIKEVAAAAEDPVLQQIAEKCTNPDPDKRPGSVSVISLPKPNDSDLGIANRIISSRLFTYIMGAVCACLTIAIVIMLYVKHLILL